MSGFTDEDLKRLKEGIEKLAGYKDKNEGYAGLSFTWPEIKALIARLEAAEHYIHECRFYHCAPTDDVIEACWKAWRKASGKDVDASKGEL